MSIQELEKQLLSLDQHERQRLSQLLSLDVPVTVEPVVGDQMGDRTPQHPLRGMPIDISANFDAPMPDLWDALECGIMHPLS